MQVSYKTYSSQDIQRIINDIRDINRRQLNIYIAVDHILIYLQALEETIKKQIPRVEQAPMNADSSRRKPA